MHKNIYSFNLISFLLLFIFGCSEQDRSPYFPLTEKIQWQYKSMMVYKRRSVESKLILENIDSKKVNGKTIFTKLHHSGNRSYFFQSDDAILKNSNNPDFNGIDAYKESHFVLPINMKSGDEWQLHSRPYVMERYIEYEVAQQTSTPALKLSNALYMIYKVDSLNETVSVPAGKFRNCVKISGNGTCQMTASGGNFSGSIDVNVEQISWYCPEIGLTKTTRTEEVSNNLLEPVTYLQELEKIIRN